MLPCDSALKNEYCTKKLRANSTAVVRKTRQGRVSVLNVFVGTFNASWTKSEKAVKVLCLQHHEALADPHMVRA